MPGSVAVAALVTCTLFATATGIVGAVVTLMGLLALPAMLKAKYDVRYATGVICSGGTLGILIPPSILLIVYAATSGVSVVRMYAAALLPGLFLAGLYLSTVGKAPRSRTSLPKRRRNRSANILPRNLLMMFTSFVPLAFLILAVLGAILFGPQPLPRPPPWRAGGLLLAVAYRARLAAAEGVRLSHGPHLGDGVLAVRRLGNLCFDLRHLGGSSSLPTRHRSRHEPADVPDRAQIIIFILGWPLEWTEIIVIFIPIFLPLLPHFGIDPLFFGILVAVNLQTAFLSPPMAMSAYYLKGIAPAHVQISDIFRGMMPYMLIVILCMVLIYMFPQIVYWLPNLIYG